MRNPLLYLTAFLFLIFAMEVQAQPYYFSHSSSPYTPLQNVTSISNGQVWNDDEYTVQIGFPFQFNGETFTSLTLGADGEVEFDSNDEPGIMIFETDLVDRGTSTSESEISTFLYGAPGNQIRIIDWRNAGFAMGDASDSVNFQLWLYESNGRIDIRFGASSIDDLNDAFDGETGPGIGLVYNGNFSQGAFTGFVLQGPSDAPQTVSLTTPSSTDYFLNGMPSQNKVFTFTTSPVLATADEVISSLPAYPNPATDVLIFATGQPVQASVFNSIGKLVLQQTTAQQLAIGHLPAGVYFLQTEQNGQRQMQRFVKQ